MEPAAPDELNLFTIRKFSQTINDVTHPVIEPHLRENCTYVDSYASERVLLQDPKERSIGFVYYAAQYVVLLPGGLVEVEQLRPIRSGLAIRRGQIAPRAVTPCAYVDGAMLGKGLSSTRYSSAIASAVPVPLSMASAIRSKRSQ